MYLIQIESVDRENLRNLISWDNLYIGESDDFIWIKGFTENQINSIEIKSIPRKKIFTEKNNKLYLFKSRLPHASTIKLNWIPIKSFFSIRIDHFNHNFFGVKSSINIILKEIQQEVSPTFLLVELNHLAEYVEYSFSFRIERLKWLIINNTHALIKGTPLLPLPGELFWERDKMVFPLGLDLELPILQPILLKSLNEDDDKLIFWNKEGTFFTVYQDEFIGLTLSSVRKTITNINHV